MIRHKKTTILLDATEETTVSQLKSTLEGIMKKPVDEQQLYKVDTKELLDDGRTLGDSGYKSSNAKAQEPATIGLRFKIGMYIYIYSFTNIVKFQTWGQLQCNVIYYRLLLLSPPKSM